MDREDARFVANALESRIIGARVELEQLAASSLMRLSAIATRIDKQNDGAWVPAAVASEEIMSIARLGGKIVDVALDPARLCWLEAFIASMHKLAAEPAQPMNRAERRALASRRAKLLIPRSKRLITAGAINPLEILR